MKEDVETVVRRCERLRSLGDAFAQAELAAEIQPVDEARVRVTEAEREVAWRRERREPGRACRLGSEADGDALGSLACPAHAVPPGRCSGA